MESAARYEIVDTIAAGDFATVYRARDRELGREVAIKQVHQQFLADQRQLARYWQEAQLLASLQHPNIVTIYDITRSRGWLILELMRGSMKPYAEGDSIDLDTLRVALIDALAALQFLHQNGVIHGDVKPSNLLIDARNRVKLGDFGLARRASNEEGSLLKGTTKYMAPELINPQFGAVGPASDLYSLGFSAYELMCGVQFESLFPGLGSFGRDRQIAWMMWHAAGDRHLPEIGKVLEGVPDDLARAVQKMIVKDPGRRYQSAAEVLRDLRPDPRLATGMIEQEDAAEEAARMAAVKRRRRLRYLAIPLAACSIVLCLAILWPHRPEKHPPAKPQPMHGVVAKVMADYNPPQFDVNIVDRKGTEIRKTIEFHPQQDRVSINGAAASLSDLKEDDVVEIEDRTDAATQAKIKEVRASRPKRDEGLVQSVQAEEDALVLAVKGGDNPGKPLRILVPRNLRIMLNGNADLNGKPVALGDLAPNDRVEVHHTQDEKARRATKLEAQRTVTTKGILRDVDLKKGTLTIARDGADSDRLTLPWGSECNIILNGEAKIGQRLIKPADLKPGDEVALKHDKQVSEIDAQRVNELGGVLQRITEGTVDVLHQGDAMPVTYRVGPKCKITLGEESVSLDDLRVGDTVELTHNRSEGTRNPEALTLSARRPPDATRWAILIGTQNYEDKTLPALDYPVADATLLADVLVKRYKVPADQAVLFLDESRVRLEQGSAERLAKIGAEGKLLIYVGGHALKDDKGTVYFAPKNFDSKDPDRTGLPLQWLVDQMEQCPAKEKLLLLDCCQGGGKAGEAEAGSEPSTAEMLAALKAPPDRSPLRTVTAVVSCEAGQRGHAWPAKNHGLFAWCLADAYSGRADANRDGRLEPTELFEFMQKSMEAAGRELKVAETPKLVLPDATPPRLSEDAKKAIRKLAAALEPASPNVEAAKKGFHAAQELAGKEIEPRVLYGLILLKAKDYEPAMKHLEELKVDKPALLFPMQGIAWVHFEKRSYKLGTKELAELVAKIPEPEHGAAYSPQVQQLFSWIGRLRELAATTEDANYRPAAESLAALDAAVTAHGGEAEQFYQEGRDHTRDVIAKFDQQVSEAKIANNNAGGLRVKFDRRQLGRYAEFPWDGYIQDVLSGLDRG